MCASPIWPVVMPITKIQVLQDDYFATPTCSHAIYLMRRAIHAVQTISPIVHCSFAALATLFMQCMLPLVHVLSVAVIGLVISEPVSPSSGRPINLGRGPADVAGPAHREDRGRSTQKTASLPLLSEGRGACTAHTPRTGPQTHPQPLSSRGFRGPARTYPPHALHRQGPGAPQNSSTGSPGDQQFNSAAFIAYQAPLGVRMLRCTATQTELQRPAAILVAV